MALCDHYQISPSITYLHEDFAFKERFNNLVLIFKFSQIFSPGNNPNDSQQVFSQGNIR